MTIPVLDPNDISDTWLTLVQRVNTMIGRFNDLNTYDDIVVTGGTISGATITTPSLSAVSATITSSLTLSGATITLDNDAISGDKISGGTIDDVMVELSATPTANNHATSKQYVDGLIGTLGSLASLNTINNTNWSGQVLAVSNGGTGASSQINARANLGLAIGSDVQAFSAMLSSVTSISSNGFISRTATNTVAPRSITAGTGITVTNGDGVSGNPAISIPQAIATTSTVQFGSLGLGTSPPVSGNLSVQKTAHFIQEVDNGTKADTFNIDWREGQKQRVVIGGSNLTMTFTNPAGAGHYQLKILQDGVGGRTKGTWPLIRTAGGGAENWALSAGSGATDILNLYFDGLSWWGQLSLEWF
jgi:hypothetical protein